MAVKDSVFEILSANRNSYFSGEDLSDRLGVSRAAVWKAIKALQKSGYAIEAVSGKGYKMLSDNHSITEDSLIHALPAELRKNQIIVYDVTDSTNLKAKELALKGAAHGTVVVSNQQTAGRGRLGRSFFSPKEGLYLSIVIKPDFDLSKATMVTIAAASAVAEAIDFCREKAGNTDYAPARIKWVNDIFISGKKVCGILTEAIADFESGQIDSLVIGIGVNTSLRGFPADLLETAGAVEDISSKADLAAEIIRRTLANIEQIGSEGTPAFIDGYRQRDLLKGRSIKVYKGVYRKNPAEEIGGIDAVARGIDDSGGLMVEYMNGSRETLTSGEVSIRL